MDRLSKLGIMAAEVLLNTHPATAITDPLRTAIVLSNSTSSTDTDLKYQQLLNSCIAAPAVFVYTLPNIVNGEICIRHGIKGENAFLLNKQFNAMQQTEYIQLLFGERRTDQCIGGWVEISGENYGAFLYLVSPLASGQRLEKTLLAKLYLDSQTY